MEKKDKSLVSRGWGRFFVMDDPKKNCREKYKNLIDFNSK